MLTMYPEGFGPLTITVIKGKGKGVKVSTDVCGCCFRTFKGKTALESAEQLKAHVAVCPKYRAATFRN